MTPVAFLKANLCFLHGTMTASEGLLEAAIARSEGELLDYFWHHLDEERGHLPLLEQDLATLGVRKPVRFPAAAQLAGAQYYYIAHDHPAMLLGFMAAMESKTPTPEAVAELERTYGPLPCTRHHALHDPRHTTELAEAIGKLRSPLRLRVEQNRDWTLNDFRDRIIPMIVRASHHFEVSA